MDRLSTVEVRLVGGVPTYKRKAVKLTAGQMALIKSSPQGKIFLWFKSLTYL